MDLYVLDDLFRRIRLIDYFESLIWTERWQSIGDFELELRSTHQTRAIFDIRFEAEIRLAILSSYRVMVVETVEEKTDDSGKEILYITGRSLEKILEDRVAKWRRAEDTTDGDGQELTATPRLIANMVFNNICRDGELHPDDVLPYLQIGSIISVGNLPESDPITWVLHPSILYTALRDICVPHNLGFRLLRNKDNTELFFDVFPGADRTSAQEVVTPVIFDARLDNFNISSDLLSNQNVKNTVYGMYGRTVDDVYLEDDHWSTRWSIDYSGFERRSMLRIKEENDPRTIFAINHAALLNQNTRPVSLLDGEVNKDSEHVYGTHYQIGDIIEVRNNYGAMVVKRVTECIFVSDSLGDRVIPTFSEPYYAEGDA